MSFFKVSQISCTPLYSSRSQLRHFDPFFEFREEYLYTNYPFVLAGYVTEVATGVTWEDAVTSLFGELGADR